MFVQTQPWCVFHSWLGDVGDVGVGVAVDAAVVVGNTYYHQPCQILAARLG